MRIPRSTESARVALRTALGAGTWRVVRQLLTESTMVSIAGGAVGVVIAIWGVPVLIALSPAGMIPRLEMIRIDCWVLAFTAGISVTTGILFGLLPAFQVWRF